MPLPLEGVRVVDFATVLAGPFGAMLLADQGAEVIKIEPPDGDSSRNMGPVPGTDHLSYGYLAFNRNKRGVALDITTPEGREVAYRLCQWADVVIINMRVDARQRRGFTYEDLSKVNPRLIYVSLTGYGDDGPDADLPGADITIQARIGDLAGRRVPGEPPPRHTQLFHFDMATSMLSAWAVVLALRERDRTGLGQKIETNLLQSGLSLHAIQMVRVEGMPEGHPARPTGLAQIYRCSDGRYILDQHINVTLRWDSLCAAMGTAELTDDPRFATLEGRQQHLPEIQAILERMFLTRTAAEWDAHLKSHGHMMSMIHDIDEFFGDPQLIANQMIATFDQPGAGEVTAIARPFRASTSANEAWLRRPAPATGEHTDEVLAELGYTADQIAALRASGGLG